LLLLLLLKGGLRSCCTKLGTHTINRILKQMHEAQQLLLQESQARIQQVLCHDLRYWQGC
jgi:hypothetical protein